MADDQNESPSPGAGRIVRVSAGLFEADVNALNELSSSLELPRAVLLREAVGDFVRRIQQDELTLAVGPDGDLQATPAGDGSQKPGPEKSTREKPKARKTRQKPKRKKPKGKKKKKKN
jgi:hypothetical protein